LILLLERNAMRKSLIVGLALFVCGCARKNDADLTGFMRMLDSAEPNERYTAADAIGSYGPKGATAADALARAVKDSDRTVRIKAAYALAQIGPDAVPALTSLIEALQDTDADVRVAAAYAIPAVCGDHISVRESLKAALKDPSQDVRSEAARALRKIDIAVKFRAKTSRRPQS
jgi:HEAT repeat protein